MTILPSFSAKLVTNWLQSPRRPANQYHPARSAAGHTDLIPVAAARPDRPDDIPKTVLASIDNAEGQTGEPAPRQQCRGDTWQSRQRSPFAVP